MRQAEVGMTPDRIEPAGQQAAHDAVTEGPEQRQPGSAPYCRQKLMPVAAQQIDIPGNLAVESGVEMFADGDIAREKDGQVNRWIFSNPAQQRRLILDRV